MTATIAVTSNWQIHIPKAMRELIGLKKPGMVEVSAKRGTLSVKPKKSGILALGGSLHSYYKKNPINVDKIRDHIDYLS